MQLQFVSTTCVWCVWSHVNTHSAGSLHPRFPINLHRKGFTGSVSGKNTDYALTWHLDATICSKDATSSGTQTWWSQRSTVPGVFQRSSGRCRSDPSPWLLPAPPPPGAGQTGLNDRTHIVKATEGKKGRRHDSSSEQAIVPVIGWPLLWVLMSQQRWPLTCCISNLLFMSLYWSRVVIIAR